MNRVCLPLWTSQNCSITSSIRNSHLWLGPGSAAEADVEQSSEGKKKWAPLSSSHHSPRSSSALNSFMLKLEKPPQYLNWKAAWQLCSGLLHTRNAASERVWGTQTHDKPSTSLKRPRHPCSVILSHSSLFISCAGSERCTFSWSKYEHSYINPEGRQLLAFAHFKTLVVTFNKIMFNKTKSIC